MHSNRLGGPVWWFFVVVLVITAAIAIFVVVDSLRRMRRGGADQRSRLLFYTAPQGLYLVLLGVAQLSAVTPILAGVAVIVTPLALAQSVVYLLRVVFPKPHPGANSGTAPR